MVVTGWLTATKLMWVLGHRLCMSERPPEERSAEPVTVASMTADLRDLGVARGDTVLVHGSLSSLGWVCGGAPAVVDALQRTLGEAGTLVMPTHSPGNMEPSAMEHPPLPESWHGTVREQMPPYRPAMTPTQGMGAIAECFRSCPGVVRSDHPQHSFAAWGADADDVTGEHSLEYSLGEASPLARVYDREGQVVFLGTDHATNTSIHLAEYRTDLDVGTRDCGSAILVDGEREWVTWEDIDFSDEDFPACGAAFERERPEAFETGTVGAAEAKRIDQRALVDFAVEWFEANR
ncbi:aminoglycoside 3-N-acetyltransferase [Halovenus aranensis]|uniref:Aminoglycoside 3-N-acetyltransferase n=2 Tax=Halovenus aranensis TaxID=890420 RepID=A0A1G8VTL8_9EURY|nr:aminoglycoside 3-N-acetyltransferase [Halovenus aranensis]